MIGNHELAKALIAYADATEVHARSISLMATDTRELAEYLLTTVTFDDIELTESQRRLDRMMDVVERLDDCQMMQALMDKVEAAH